MLFAFVEDWKAQHPGGEAVDWHMCAAFVGSRSQRQCYDKFQLHGDQENAQRHKWTVDEDAVLRGFSDFGGSWKDFQQQFFPKMSLSQLKNEYQSLNSDSNGFIEKKTKKRQQDGKK